jgi:septum formation protein
MQELMRIAHAILAGHAYYVPTQSLVGILWIVMQHLILAGGSVSRKHLLENAGYRVTAVVSGVTEPDLAEFPDLGAGLIYLAQLKARAVERRGYSGLVLGADTVSLTSSSILGKPRDIDDAAKMLRQLSGSTHSVLTGFCLLRTTDGLALSGVERTEITMRPWTEMELIAYLKRGEWEGKCGAYGLELPHDPFVTHMQGSASNVIGVPLERLASLLSEFPSLSPE